MRLVIRSAILAQLRRKPTPILTLAAQGVRQGLAEAELRRLALVGTPGVAEEIAKQVRREHREATSGDREIVKDLRAEGGLCRPSVISREDFMDRVPRPLRGPAGRCVAADELAQDLFTKGLISEPRTDALLDFLRDSHRRARSKPDIPEPRELRAEARRLIRQRVKRGVRELVRTARRQAEAVCPVPLPRVAVCAEAS